MYNVHIECQKGDKYIRRNVACVDLDTAMETLHRYVYGAKYDGYVIKNIAINIKGQ